MRRPTEGPCPGAPARWAALTLVVVCGVGSGAGGAEQMAHDHSEPTVLAPGYADLEFEPPVPGTYRLPPLGAAADGQVLDSDGRSLRLYDLFDGRLVLLSFIYTTCSDVNGCPLATHVLNRVALRLASSEALRDEVRLLSLSFDPDHDTPAVMRTYGTPYGRSGLDWRFLTTAGQADLDPILDGYGQWVIRDVDAAGNSLGTMSHLLRVFLIDGQRQIRNIYSVSYLHAETIASDLETLLMETQDLRQ